MTEGAAYYGKKRARPHTEVRNKDPDVLGRRIRLGDRNAPVYNASPVSRKMNSENPTVLQKYHRTLLTVNLVKMENR